MRVTSTVLSAFFLLLVLLGVYTVVKSRSRTGSATSACCVVSA